MRVTLARVLFTGLLAISLQACLRRAADATAVTQRASDPIAQAQQMLPATLALLQSIEQAAIAHGRVLTADEMRIARQLGVAQPQRVRVLVSPVLPSWMVPDLAMNAAARFDPANNGANPNNPSADTDRASRRRFGVAGITAGHGILLGIYHANDPRVLAHELAHVAQYERLGLRAFALRYLTEVLSVGYYRAPLEMEADAAMRRVLALPK